MAKRGSTRRSRGESEAADDDFGWQAPDVEEPPPRKKKKRTKRSSADEGSTRAAKKDTGRTARDTGRAKATGSSGTSAKASAKRRRPSSSAENPVASGATLEKSARRRRSSSSSGDDEVSTSSRRRRAVPPKKKGADPVVLISIVSITLLICVGYIVISSLGGGGEVRDEQAMFDRASELRQEGETAYGEWQRARRDGPPEVELAKHKEALTKLTSAMELYERMLEDHTGPDGYVKADFAGYDADRSQIGQLIHDLLKEARAR